MAGAYCIVFFFPIQVGARVVVKSWLVKFQGVVRVERNDWGQEEIKVKVKSELN